MKYLLVLLFLVISCASNANIHNKDDLSAQITVIWLAPYVRYCIDSVNKICWVRVSTGAASISDTQCERLIKKYTTKQER